MISFTLNNHAIEIQGRNSRGVHAFTDNWMKEFLFFFGKRPLFSAAVFECGRISIRIMIFELVVEISMNLVIFLKI
jgi:hypothetical protein